jgi:hypothetical protein
MIHVPTRNDDVAEPADGDDADRDRALALCLLTTMQSDIIELRANTARTVADMKAENWRLIQQAAVRDAPPVWWALKPAAADVGIEYENCRFWCKRGVVVAKKVGGRWFVEMGSLRAHVGALRGKQSRR